MQPMTKLAIPPMPTLESDAPLWPYINRLEAWSQECATIAQREAALADELAEALGKGCRILDCYRGSQTAFDALLSDFDAALRAYTAARQMNKEAR